MNLVYKEVKVDVQRDALYRTWSEVPMTVSDSFREEVRREITRRTWDNVWRHIDKAVREEHGITEQIEP